MKVENKPQNCNADVEILKTNATHEAGHAVAFYLQFGLDELHRIGELKIGEQLSFFRVVDMFEPTRDEEEKEAIMYCAGYAALIVAEYSEDVALLGTESDFARATEKCSSSIEILKAAAVKLLASEKAAQLVQALSEQLLIKSNVSATELQNFFLAGDNA